ncbi:MAG: hypothetical protein MUO77_07660 [Anaerolineales bacterium]|nr:hypothetical protein [Anaerolineales bacterium]
MGEKSLVSSQPKDWAQRGMKLSAPSWLPAAGHGVTQVLPPAMAAFDAA